MIKRQIIIFVLAVLPLSATAQIAQAVNDDGQATIATQADSYFDSTGRSDGTFVKSRRWTLSECIDWARKNNIQLQQQQLYEKDARIAVGQAKLDYLPSLGAGASYNTTFAESFDPVSQNTQSSYSSINASASLSADIFAGFKKLHNLRRSELSLQQTLASIERAANDLSLNVTAAYLEILYAEERVNLSKAQMSTLELQVENSRKLVDAGKSTYADLLQLQAQAADVRQQLIQNSNQRTMAYFNLCQLLEIEDYENFRVIAPEQMVIAADAALSPVGEILDAAQSLPQVEAARLGVEIAERDIKIARADRYPTLRLSAGYGSSYSTNLTRLDPTNPDAYIDYSFRDQMKDHATPSVSVSLNIPIFNSFQIRDNIRSKKIALQRADFDRILVEKRVNSDVQQAYIDARGALEQYRSAIVDVETTDEAFRIMEQKFNLGAATPVDYSMALYNLTNSQAQLYQAKYQYIFKSKILDFYKGIPIELY